MKFGDVDSKNNRSSKKEGSCGEKGLNNSHNRLSEEERIRENPRRIDVVCLEDKERRDFRRRKLIVQRK